VLVSERTADLVEGELGAGMRVRPLGLLRLKDLPQPQRLFQAVADDLPSDFPPPKGSAEAPALAGAANARTRAERLKRLWVPAAALSLLVIGVGAAWIVGSRDPAEPSAIRSNKASSQQETAAAAFTALPVETTTAPTPPAPRRLTADSVGVIHPDGRRVLAQVRVGPDPRKISVGPDAVWVAVGNNTIARVDPKTRSMVAAIGTENQVDDLAAGDDAVWVLAARPGSAPQLSRVETGTNIASASVRVDVGLSRFGTEASRPAIALGSDSVWITDPYPPGQLKRVDVSTMKVAGAVPLPLPGGPAITVDGRDVWVNTGIQKLARVDVASRKLSGTIQISPPSVRTGPATGTRDRGGPIRLAAGEGALWLITHPASACCPVQVFGTGTLQRIDPDARVVTGVVPIDGYPTGVAVGLGAVWVGTREGSLYRIQPETLAFRRLELGHPIGGVAVGRDAVWVTLRSSG
jgi:hypothetical protein